MILGNLSKICQQVPRITFHSWVWPHPTQSIICLSPVLSSIHYSYYLFIILPLFLCQLPCFVVLLSSFSSRIVSSFFPHLPVFFFAKPPLFHPLAASHFAPQSKVACFSCNFMQNWRIWWFSGRIPVFRVDALTNNNFEVSELFLTWILQKLTNVVSFSTRIHIKCGNICLSCHLLSSFCSLSPALPCFAYSSSFTFHRYNPIRSYQIFALYFVYPFSRRFFITTYFLRDYFSNIFQKFTTISVTRVKFFTKLSKLLAHIRLEDFQLGPCQNLDLKFLSKNPICTFFFFRNHSQIFV